MISRLPNRALAQFLLLPNLHKYGIFFLCGLLTLLGFSQSKDSEKITAYVQTSSILGSPAHAASISLPVLKSDEAKHIIKDQGQVNQLQKSNIDSHKALAAQHITKPAQKSLEPSAFEEEAIPVEKANTRETNKVITETVQKNDTLSKVFQRAGVANSQMYRLLNSHKKAKELARIYPGHKLKFTTNIDGNLITLNYIKSSLEQHVFTKIDDRFEFEEIIRKPEIRIVRTEGVITHSLYGAAKKAKLEDRLTMKLASIFGWDVDFALDIRANDSFIVVYEEKFLDNKKLGTGNIIAAEFTNKGNRYQAVRYADKKGNAQYYTPEGNTMRKAFLRTPIEFARISSHFNLRRKHPVLNTIRAHKGTDYAAPRGTPIKTTGDGKVTFAGRKGGYGNVLIIQHGQTYETRYAHLKAFAKNVRRGKTVKQGQVIGYVGTTGLSSGPHLHYEFRVNGVVRNPVTVKLPKANPIAKSERSRFFAQTKNAVAALQNPAKRTQVATKDRDNSSKTTTTPL